MIIHLFFPLYAFGCPHNFLELPTNLCAMVGLLVLAAFQVFLLNAQDKWGSRFFIPKMLQPDYHDYHQAFLMNPDDLETCAICMTVITQAADDIVINNDQRVRMNLDDLVKSVLTTPCNHRFCQDCLIRWMEIKMICPTCRRKLPRYNF